MQGFQPKQKRRVSVDEQLAWRQELFKHQAVGLLSEVKRGRAFGQWRIRIERLQKTMTEIEQLCRPAGDEPELVEASQSEEGAENEPEDDSG